MKLKLGKNPVKTLWNQEGADGNIRTLEEEENEIETR